MTWGRTLEFAYAEANENGYSGDVADRKVTNLLLAWKHFAALEEHLRLLARQRGERPS